MRSRWRAIFDRRDGCGMNPILGWALAALLLVAAWQGYGIKGIALGVTLIVFWLILQFNRSLRVMRNAGLGADRPRRQRGDAECEAARRHADAAGADADEEPGRRVDPGADVYEWADAGGSKVVVTFANGRCQRWQLERPADAPHRPRSAPRRGGRIESSPLRGGPQPDLPAPRKDLPCRWPIATERSGWTARWSIGATPRSTC
jgi:hypothetical protein